MSDPTNLPPGDVPQATSASDYERYREERERWHRYRLQHIQIVTVSVVFAACFAMGVTAFVIERNNRCHMKLAVSEIRLENAQRRLPETPIARVEPTIADATQLTATAYLLGRLQDRPNPLARLQAGNLAQLLQPLESTTAIPHETVTKVIDTALDGAKEITVDGVKQGLGKLLEDSKKGGQRERPFPPDNSNMRWADYNTAAFKVFTPCPRLV